MNNWKSIIVNNLKKELEIKELIRKAVDEKSAELRKIFKEIPELANFEIKRVQFNIISINMKIVTIEFEEVIRILIDNYKIRPLDATKDDIDNVVEDIISKNINLPK